MDKKLIKFEDFIITLESYPYVVKVPYDDFYMVGSPLMNCQHFSIGGFEKLLREYEVIPQLSEIKKLFDGENRSKRYNILVDVSFGHEEMINQYFEKDTILSKSVYTSSNGNIRILYILSLKNIS